MSGEERYEQTKQNLIDTANFKEPKKVVTNGFFDGWAFEYAGVKREEVVDDPEAFARAYTKVYEDLVVDTTFFYGPTRVTPKPSLLLGSDKFVYSSDGIGIVHNQAGDVYWGPEVYDLIIEDYDAVIQQTARNRAKIFQLPRQEALEALKAAAIEQRRCDAILEKIFNRLRFDIGVYEFNRLSVRYTSEFWLFFDRLRGPHNALADLRRYPDKVYAACDFLWERTRKTLAAPPPSTLDALPGEKVPEDWTSPLPLGFTMYHPEPYLSPKHYDDLYFKRFMEVMLPAMEAGKKVFFYGEGAFMHQLHRFRETPKGSMIIGLEQDDPFEAHKIIGDWATLIAAPSPELLCLGTKQQVVDTVKKLFDVLAPGGGFIFGQHTGMLTAKDAKVENVVAAYETADALARGGRA